MTLTTKMQLADKLTELAIANGGATLSTTDASEIRNGYTIGGGILKTADALAEIPASLTATEIRNKIYFSLMLAAEELQGFQAVGVWVSKGVVYLDAVTIESNFIKAVVTGLTRKQQAIGSLKNGAYEEIATKASVTPTKIKENKMATKKTMATSEAGFSLIELAGSAAIMLTLAAMAASSFQGVADGIKSQQLEVQEMEQNRAAELQGILDGFGN